MILEWMMIRDTTTTSTAVTTKEILPRQRRSINILGRTYWVMLLLRTIDNNKIVFAMDDDIN